MTAVILTNYKECIITNIKDIMDTSIYTNHITPDVCIIDYIDRLDCYTAAKNAPVLWYISDVYINRLISNYAISELTWYNVHRIISITLIMAIKFYDDCCFSNAYYATVCGITLKEFNDMERKFLEDIDWNLYVNIIDYVP